MMENTENGGRAPRRRARRVSLLAGATATTVVILLGVAIVREDPRMFRRLFEREKVGHIVPQQSRIGHSVHLTAGTIPVTDFLRFLSNYTGLPVLHDSTDQNLTTGQITIAADIPEADEDVVKAILEVNRVRIWREVLPNGKELLKVESIVAATGGLTNPVGLRNISER
jgi:hypothetical protein